MPGVHQVLPFPSSAGQGKENITKGLRAGTMEGDITSTSVTQPKSSESAHVYVTKYKCQGEKLDENHEKIQYRFNKEE